MNIHTFVPVNIDVEKLLAMTEYGQTLTDEKKAELVEIQAKRKEQKLDEVRRYRKKHLDELRVKNRERARKRYAADPAHVLAVNLRYYLAHRDEILKRKRARYAEKVAAAKQAAKENPD